MAKRLDIPEFGCQVVEGRPGSGKSFMLVQMIVREILEHRRPVFVSSNLPLAWPVFRRYLRLKGGEECAGLIYELSESHFRAFLERNQLRQQFMDGRRGAKGGASNTAIERDFLEQYGPNIVDADQGVPNWIIPASCIVLDEVHHWFPQRNQAKETPALQAYMTMLRHHMHLIYAATQNRMQISLTIRRQAAYFWHVENLSERKLAFNVRMKHIGMNALGYSMYTPEQEEAMSLEDSQPSKTIIRIIRIGPVTLPWQAVYFRLYRSFSHVANPRRLVWEMQDARERAGIGRDGRLDRELKDQDQGERKKERPPMMRWAMRVVRVCVLVLAVALGVAVGTAVTKQAADQELADQAERIAALEAQIADQAGQVLTWGELEMVADDSAYIDGRRVTEMETLPNGAQILDCSVDARAVVLDVDGVYWLWRVGGRPRELGERNKVDALIARSAGG
jgi:hypothetical protein